MNNTVFKKAVYFYAVFFFTTVVIAGCSPAMRKKFVRQKKEEEDNSLIPVLEPIDYPNQLETVKTRYDYFYALLKVWHKDALTLIDDSHSDKQMTYAVRQMAVQLRELGKILDGRSQQKIINGIKAVEDVLAYYEKPAAFRSRDIIRKSLKRLTDSVIRPLDYEKIKGDLKGSYESAD